MKAFIIEVTTPESWTKHDVISAMNIGLARHHDEHARSGYERVLESPGGLSTNVMVLTELPLRRV
jgi:hypothetical protein